MKYEIGKTYRARVETIGVFCSIHFKFFSNKCVLIRDVYDGDWSSHTLIPSVEIHHDTPDGTWILRGGVGESSTWLFRREGHTYVPAIYEVKEREMKGKHYDAIIEDDMVDAFAYGMTKKENVDKEVKQAVDWHKMMKEGEKRMREDLDRHMFDLPLAAARRRRQGIITNITEGGDEMDKYLYHVILFNTETEKIDFKKYVPTKDAQDAGMLAAQEFGKYDSDVHITIIKMIENSGYTKYVRLP